MDKNLHLSNLNGHKKTQLREAEQIHCCMRGIRLYADDVAYWIRGDDTINQVKACTVSDPENLPFNLQVIEWELSQVVKETSKILKEAGEAIELCHGLRAGNATLVKLMKEREKALDE